MSHGAGEAGARRVRSGIMPAGVLLVAVMALGAAAVYRAEPAESAPPTQPVAVVQQFPHDPTAFCQGLVCHDGVLLEGTGQYQHSRLRRVELETGRSLQEVRLPGDVFGEGVTVFGDQIVQLTWQNGFLIVYDVNTLVQRKTVRYRDMDNSLREGWGITHDGEQLIISDGTATLRFCDPETYRVVRKLRVRNGLRALSQLNELEYVNGLILANVWYEDRIARIDPGTGRVVDWLDLRAIRPPDVRGNREAVLNGIAWDSASRRLFVTGKHWPSLFEIRLPENPLP